MNRMFCLFALLSLALPRALFSADDPDAPRKAAARVLELKGSAAVVFPDGYRRPAATFGTLYDGDRLVLEKDSAVVLAFRQDGRVERIAAAGTFRVTADGCQPRKGVELVSMSDENRELIARLSKGPRGIVQGGVMVARSAAPKGHDDEEEKPPETPEAAPDFEPGPIEPISGSAVLSDTPEFSWTAVKNAAKYTLTLHEQGNQIWSAATEKTRLKYGGEKPLGRGALFTWEVAATIEGKQKIVCQGMFRVASRRELIESQSLEKLLAKPEPVALAVAALWYQQHEMVAEAIAVNRRLAEMSSDPAVLWTLVDLYWMAGRREEAQAAERKATELEKKLAEQQGRTEPNE
jgi:hypothetical protein